MQGHMHCHVLAHLGRACGLHARVSTIFFNAVWWRRHITCWHHPRVESICWVRSKPDRNRSGWLVLWPGLSQSELTRPIKTSMTEPVGFGQFRQTSLIQQFQSVLFHGSSRFNITSTARSLIGFDFRSGPRNLRCHLKSENPPNEIVQRKIKISDWTIRFVNPISARERKSSTSYLDRINHDLWNPSNDS